VDERLLSTFAHLRKANDETAGLEARARAYLDVNCAYCHRPGGVRANFDARFDTLLANASIINGTMIANLGSPENRVVVAGAPAHSGLYLRAAASDGLLKMPPLARNEVDTEGVVLLRDWINSLAGPAPTLSFRMTETQVFLSWPVSATNAHLELSSSLTPPAWHAVGGQVSNGTTNTISVGISADQQYFRLSSQ
jgi:hypothetical protein